ncbi:cupin domain-containing protein [Bradyrhizobium sp. dw_78]|uniref:cupin domain-containing protein n=1 Tax=Bradyrhizobium sp. dw_78 TaxID=2719793 RepID=UPI00201C5017|nr:cupin domain-containing protein [Bradyrhizobium sp. dw_78]
MVLTRRMLGGALLLGALVRPAMAETDEKGFVRIRPDDVPWNPPSSMGTISATLSGDPSKPGVFYVIRVKFQPGVHSVPHTHPEARHVTVLKGTWYTGTGETVDFNKAVPLTPGSYMMHPAGAAHWDGAGDEEVIIQITGLGPSTTVPVHPGTPETGYWPKPKS